jgi:hypothetical protein
MAFNHPPGGPLNLKRTVIKTLINICQFSYLTAAVPNRMMVSIDMVIGKTTYQNIIYTFLKKAFAVFFR